MNREIAATIIKQLGGRQFITCTGAKNFTFNDTHAIFKIGRNHRGINGVWIAYDRGQDLYNMIFKKISLRKTGRHEKIIEEYKGVYCDQLESLFSDATGMETRIPKVLYG